MPPPRLSATTSTHVPPADPSPSTSAETSCNIVKSPTSPIALDPAATPNTVETTPSIPLTPRFANVTASLGGAHHSTSRTGIDEPTTSVAPDSLLAVTTNVVGTAVLSLTGVPA